MCFINTLINFFLLHAFVHMDEAFTAWTVMLHVLAGIHKERNQMMLHVLAGIHKERNQTTRPEPGQKKREVLECSYHS